MLVRSRAGTAFAGLTLAAAALAGPLPGAVHAADAADAAEAATAPSPAAAAPAAASPSGSVVFVRNYNVWIARADGTVQRPLTSDGSFGNQWLSPSQADDGTVVAAHDERIVVMNPAGRVLRRLDPPALTSSVGERLDGTPTDVAISPDGSLVAYTFALFSCPPAADCDTRSVTAYTRVDEVTDPARFGTTFGDAPGWIGDHRTVQGGGQIPVVRLHDLGTTGGFEWFRDSQISSPGRELTEPAVSRDGQFVASIRGWGDHTSVLWSRVNGSASTGRPGVPTPVAETNEEPLSGPAFSADGAVLAWTTAAGITYKPEPGDWRVQPVLTIDRGSQPSFSAARYSVPAPQVVTRPSISGTAKAGRTLTARPGSWTPGTTSLAYTWLRDGRPVAGARARTYRVGSRDAGHRISVRVTAKGAGGTTTVTSTAVRVGR
ncbi:hypothetical protein GCM10023340_31840 [Nocardioides marinquilinus]|uniref:PKD domain-containing protein n=1 Tax=Nocardioides marinquilinus TaxID=1210400 RepID=A0ABP9PU57_9ACTN